MRSLDDHSLALVRHEGLHLGVDASETQHAEDNESDMNVAGSEDGVKVTDKKATHDKSKATRDAEGEGAVTRALGNGHSSQRALRVVKGAECDEIVDSGPPWDELQLEPHRQPRAAQALRLVHKAALTESSFWKALRA